MIYEFTPYAQDKRYGKVLNDCVSITPQDSWICIRDRDTMYLDPNSGDLLYEAIRDNPDCKFFTCSTNRVFGQPLSDNTDILNHFKKTFEKREEKSYIEVTGVVPAFFWLFHRSVWEENKFDELPIIANHMSFDARWTKRLNIKKIRIEHLYIFHFYRLNKHHREYSHLK